MKLYKHCTVGQFSGECSVHLFFKLRCNEKNAGFTVTEDQHVKNSLRLWLNDLQADGLG